MKPQGKRPRIRPATAAWLLTVMITIVALPFAGTLAQEAFTDEAGTEVLTRGPVHEAFAGVISYDSLPGVVVAAAPPELIEEIPPGERPVGDDVTWIPGYWAWDDDRNDFLWVSGIWRALPPGREWIVGYWAETTAGYQWTSGYWADAVAEEITYLPAPPRSVEEGPNIAAPSSNHGWTPGCWVWTQQRYAWSPGYWAEVRPDWDWMPAHYVWTRRGHVFVDGYWDHSVQHRGVLFAPVYFDRGVHSRPGYSYSPTIVIDLNVFASHLFLRPNYDHYYFGDYYAPRYRENGFFASFSYTSSRRGYDSIYARQRWEHRDDKDWERRNERDYQFRRDDESARPPHTWAALSRMDARSPDVQRNRSMLATSLDKLSEREDSTTRFQSVDQDDRQLLARRGKEVQESREERRELEGTDAENQREGGKIIASKVPSFETPIEAKPRNKEKGEGAPPEPQRGPRPAEGGSAENPSQSQPGRPFTDREGKDMKPDAPQLPGGIPQPQTTQPQPGRPSEEGEGRVMKPDAPQVPGGIPQPPTTRTQPGRPSADGEGKDMKPDAPQVPGGIPQPPTTRPQPGRPFTDGEGRDMKPDAPQTPQTRPEQPAQEESGRTMKPEAPQAPQNRPDQPTPQPQPSRPTQEERGREMRPEAPQNRPEEPSPRPQPSRPTQEESGRNMNPQAPQAPQNRPEQPTPRPQPSRPAQEERGREMRPEAPQNRPEQSSPRPQPTRPAQEEAGRDRKPEAPQTRNQEPPSRPEPARPAQEERSREKKGSEEPRGKEKRD